MRIIAGDLRGRKLLSPNTRKTRPTSDRARAGMASALAARGLITGSQVLELYAGTGAFAFEMLSRGAVSAVLVEHDRRMLEIIRKNAVQLGLASRTRVIAYDLEDSLARLISQLQAQASTPFDLVFADPPYAKAEAAGTVLAELLAARLLGRGSTVVVEHRASSPQSLGNYATIWGKYRYGDAGVTMATVIEDPDPL